jgi:hypothetical protein
MKTESSKATGARIRLKTRYVKDEYDGEALEIGNDLSESLIGRQGII